MPLVHWVDDGFDGAADAMRRTDDSFWSVDASTLPPCGFCIAWGGPSRPAAATANRGLRRFLRELERIRNRRRRMWIELRGAQFTIGSRRGRGRNDNDDGDEEPLRLLFGAVLPRHPLLDELRIVRCNTELANDVTINELCRGLTAAAQNEAVPTDHRRRKRGDRVAHWLSASAPSPSIPLPCKSCLRNVHLNGSVLGSDGLDSLARMLASNAASSLESLAIIDCDFRSASVRACNDLLRALEGNTHLINLRLVFPNADLTGDVSREAAIALSRSRVTCLKLRNRHPSTAPALIDGLRSNRTLEDLHLSVENDEDSTNDDNLVLQFQDLVKHFNFTLREVRLHRDGFAWLDPKDQQRHFEPWLRRRNVAVRSAYQGLVGRQFRVRQVSLWDRAMERISSKPDLLYRFLRVGNVDLLDWHLGAVPPKHQTKAPVRRPGAIVGGTNSTYQVIFL